jgi:hypothetical protein
LLMSIPLNHIFTANTFSLIFPNFLSLLPQTEPMPSQVWNYNKLPKNQEAHRQRSLQKRAPFRCPCDVCLPIIIHCMWCNELRLT